MAGSVEKKFIREALDYMKKAKNPRTSGDRTGKMDDWGLEHIITGDSKLGQRRRKGTGYHYRPGGSDMPGRRTDLTGSTQYPNGVYTGKPEYFDHQSTPPKWKKKGGNGGVSTYFPDSWSPQQVDDAVAQAYKNGSINPADPGKWSGTHNGVKIEGFVDPSKPHGYTHGWPSYPQ
ncbi:EndoU domain-containing protein [Glycomyces harbinensis]|uniref:EndoU nuclease n=1 Tax=Glycomyces harbinensis TaxID=58114 RepID=A0A1G7DYG6_9ACTN|nr:EndoU domain-containing protein [Glycomyces harbinensis]SDE56280.1 EndoU nuclease [Glycomyces harbinensis]